MNLNIRNKLIVFALLTILIPLGISALIILIQLTKVTNDRSQERIKSDARVAHSIFTKRLENLKASSQAVATSLAGQVGRPAAATAAPAAPAGRPAAGTPPAGGAAAAPARNPKLEEALKSAQGANEVSFVVLLSPQGKVIAQHTGAPVGDGNQFEKNRMFVDVNNEAQTKQPKALAGPVVELEAAIKAVNLTDQATVEGVEGAMFLEAAAPVISNGVVEGVVLLGQLVNNDVVQDQTRKQSIVNEVKKTLYPTLATDAGVVLVQGDRIVSTTLPPDAGGKAVTGTQIKDKEGTFEQPSFNEQTFSGSDYYTSFVPVQSESSKGVETVGKAGVAIKQSWFTGILRTVQLTILVVTVIALLLAIVGAVYAAQRLTRPIEELTEAANRISLGELDAPIVVGATDEIGTLAESLDRMRISLKQAIERLRKR